MSGPKLVEALQRLGYPQASQLDGGSLDWLFEYDAVQPFLDWFCDDIQANNRLDQKDVEEFSVLEQSQEGVLEGEQLDDALRSLAAGQEEDMTDEKLREEISLLEEDLAFCQQRKDLLIQQRNKLSHHRMSVGDRLAKLDSIENAAKTQYKQRLEQTQADNSKMNGGLEELLTAVTTLHTLYQSTTAGTEQELMEQKQPVFLSQPSLDNLYKMEEKFTSELTAFTKKQFFEGIADMAGENEGSRYELLEISNPDSLLVVGQKEETVFEACKEIARLQIHFPKSESLRVNAFVEEKSTSTACDFTEQKFQQIKDKPYPKDMSEISNRLKDAQSTLTILRRDLTALAEEHVPSLIKDSSTLQVTRILRGDYDLKIARQDYFMGNQDKVIELLVVQRSRNEFLTMAFELESKGHRDTYRLLTAINMLLQKMTKAQHDRMAMLKDPILNTSRNQRSTLDSRDKFFYKLHQLLDPGGFTDQPQLFVTYSQLGENADRLNNQITSLRASSSSANSSQDDRLHMLEKSVRNCEASLYSGSSTTGGHPTLSPQTIVDTMTQLDTMLKKLERSVMDIMKDVEQKKRTLHSDQLLATERELFVYFLNDPDKLRRVMDTVTGKLNARLVT